jgi:hypothetical protein
MKIMRERSKGCSSESSDVAPAPARGTVPVVAAVSAGAKVIPDAGPVSSGVIVGDGSPAEASVGENPSVDSESIGLRSSIDRRGWAVSRFIATIPAAGLGKCMISHGHGMPQHKGIHL